MMNRLIYFFLVFLFLGLPKLLLSQSLSPVFPKNGQTLNGAFELSWNESDLADAYRLKIYANSYANSLVHSSISSKASRSISLLEGHYFWRVEALFNGSAIDSSGIYTFRVFNPATIDSLNLWLRADSGVTLNGSKLSGWQDLSDSSLLITQTNLSRQPTFLDSALNNLPVVDFDAVDDLLFLNVALAKGNFSISSVYNTHEVSSRGIRLLDGTFNWLMGPHAGRHRGYNGGFLNGKDVILDQFVTHSVTSFMDTTKNFVNNIFYGQNIAAYPPGNSLEIGSNRLNGSLAELIIINGVSHDSVRQNIDNYLMDKYAPPVNLGEDRLVCSFPDSAELTIDYALDYQWNTGDTISKLIVDSAGKYYVTITDMFERQSVDSIVFTLDTSNFQVQLIPDTTLCLGEELSLSAGSDLYSYQWNTGATSNTILVDSTATYRVNLLNCQGQPSTDSVTITFNQPRFSLGSDTTICFHDSIELKTDTVFNVNYLWSTNSTDSSIQVNQAGNYSVTVTDNFSCSFVDSIQIQIDSSLAEISLGEDTSLCSGNTIGLIEPGAGIDAYLWNTMSTDSIITVSNSQTYKLTVTDNGCRNSDSIMVDIKGQAPLSGFTAANFCFGDSVAFIDTTLDPTNISLNRWQWEFGDGNSSNMQNPVHAYDSVGSYWVTLEVENDSACIGSTSQLVTVYPLPNLDFSVGLACEGDSISLQNSSQIDVGNIASYFWDFGDSSQLGDTSTNINPVYTFSTFGSYDISLKGTSNEACSDSIIKTIEVNASPQVDFTYSGLFDDDSTYFTNQSSLSNGSITTFQWSFGNNVSDSILNPSVYYGQTGVYEVTLTAISDSACVSSKVDSIEITKRPPPKPEFNTILPKNGQTVSELVDFTWNEKDSATAYRLQISSSNTFNNSVIDRQTSNESLAIPLNVSSNGSWFWRVIAMSGSVSLDTTNTAQFNFFHPMNLDSLNLWIRADSALSISNGLVSEWGDLSDSAVLIRQNTVSMRPLFVDSVLNNLPVVDFDQLNDQFDLAVALEKKDFLISTVYNVREESSRGIRLIDGTFNWLMGPHAGVHRGYNGSFLGGKAVIKDQFVTHTITSTNDTNRNFVNDVFYSENVTSFPPGSSLILGNGLNGQLAEVIIINGKSPDADRKKIDNYLMDKYAPPVNLGPDKRVCSFPDSMELLIDYALDFQWSTGDTTSKMVVDSAGKYYVTITDMFERQSVDSVFFILDTTNYQVDFCFEDTTICLGNQIELLAGRAIYDYQWNTGDSIPNLLVDSSGVYSVSVRNCLNQLSSDTIHLTVNEPRFDLGEDTTVCFNELINLQSDTSFSNVSYQWSNGQTTSSIVADTTQRYRLTVTDAYGCEYSDSILLQIDSNLYQVTLGPDTSLCEGNQIGLQNPPTNLSSYTWSTGSSQPTTPVDTSGIYTLDFSDGFCRASDRLAVNIRGLAPQADFTAAGFCFQDTVAFTDLSTAPSGDTITDWEWDFDDGVTATTMNANHLFSTPNTYQVQLKVLTDKNCEDTISKRITVHPKPEANFGLSSSVACSKNPVRFFDSSSVSSGNIIGFLWNFDDSTSANNTSNNQSPLHNFDTSGNYSVRLEVETDQGCLDTTRKMIFINPSPAVDYSMEGQCLGDSIHFQDRTVLPVGQVRDYFWAVNNEISLAKNPSFKFLEAGVFPLVLRIRTLAGCQETIRDSIEIFESPKADFSQESNCLGLPIEIKDQSTTSNSIASYQYIFDEQDTSTLANPSFEVGTSGSYPLKLVIQDLNNCEDSIQKMVVVDPTPNANFTLDIDQAGIPFDLGLNNLSSGADLFQWDFGNSDEAVGFEPNYTYTDTGNYEIQLVAINSISSCVDSVSRTLTAMPFYLDAAIDQLELFEDAFGAVGLRTRLINSGNNTIQSVSLTADVNNTIQLRETFDTELFRGRGEVFPFSGSFFQSNGEEIDFICVRILEVNGRQDENLTNNELCEDGFSEEIYLNVFPNPAKEYINFDYVLPEDGMLSIRFYDQLGRDVMKEMKGTYESGFYRTQFNVIHLGPGIYYYSLTHNELEVRGAFIKR